MDSRTGHDKYKSTSIGTSPIKSLKKLLKLTITYYQEKDYERIVVGSDEQHCLGHSLSQQPLLSICCSNWYQVTTKSPIKSGWFSGLKLYTKEIQH